MKDRAYLIVDDSIIAQRILTRSLMALGIEKERIITAQNVDSAKRAWGKFPKENGMVFLDIVIPGRGGGLGLLKKFKAESPSTIFIVQSSRSDRESIMSAKDLGADYYLIKPFEFEKLKSMLAKWG
ncbi:response regulator [bacterium]|nr:response regulator [bacterium]